MGNPVGPRPFARGIVASTGHLYLHVLSYVGTSGVRFSESLLWLPEHCLQHFRLCSSYLYQMMSKKTLVMYRYMYKLRVHTQWPRCDSLSCWATNYSSCVWKCRVTFQPHSVLQPRSFMLYKLTLFATMQRNYVTQWRTCVWYIKFRASILGMHASRL